MPFVGVWLGRVNMLSHRLLPSYLRAKRDETSTLKCFGFHIRLQQFAREPKGHLPSTPRSTLSTKTAPSVPRSGLSFREMLLLTRIPLWESLQSLTQLLWQLITLSVKHQGLLWSMQSDCQHHTGHWFPTSNFNSDWERKQKWCADLFPGLSTLCERQTETFPFPSICSCLFFTLNPMFSLVLHLTCPLLKLFYPIALMDAPPMAIAGGG